MTIHGRIVIEYPHIYDKTKKVTVHPEARTNGGKKMHIVRHLEYYSGSKEEKIPDFRPDFPYIATQVELDHYRGSFVPWHWHKALELFYMERGELRYHTPGGTLVFPAGSGGLVNSNVLHMTEVLSRTGPNIQKIHFFDPVLISGSYDSLIEQKYVTPVTSAAQLELVPLYPDDPDQADILRLIRQAFLLDEAGFGYELRLRDLLSEIWFQLFTHISPVLQEPSAPAGSAGDKIKTMMVYVHEHFSEKIAVSDLAASAYLSERECYRVFRRCLHMTPAEYVTGYRLQIACRMLAEGGEPVTSIGHACGLGSSSYFGKTFRGHLGCTPLEYRRRWQDNDKN